MKRALLCACSILLCASCGSSGNSGTQTITTEALATQAALSQTAVSTGILFELFDAGGGAGNISSSLHALHATKDVSEPQIVTITGDDDEGTCTGTVTFTSFTETAGAGSMAINCDNYHGSTGEDGTFVANGELNANFSYTLTLGEETGTIVAEFIQTPASGFTLILGGVTYSVTGTTTGNVTLVAKIGSEEATFTAVLTGTVDSVTIDQTCTGTIINDVASITCSATPSTT